jgi:signal transduction histidine kinase
MELAGRIDELEASRRRLLESGDAAARRLEAQLRAGPMRRIEGIRHTLDDIGKQAGLTPGTRDAVERAHAQADATVDDLTLLARGVRPAVVAEFGLAGALARLVSRGPFAGQLDVADGVPDDLVTDLWFMCSEAITNVEKHARAGNASVSVQVCESDVIIVISDDGVGGASLEGGSGIRGILDRVVSRHGSMDLMSRVGSGTRLRIVLPKRTRGDPR